MRAFYSYGIAGLIVVGVAAWLATGSLVIGGKGPGNGVTPIVELVEKDGGPITSTLSDSGLLADHEEDHEGPDPHLTIAQRKAEVSGEEAPALSVRTVTYTMEPLPLEVALRGRTEAKSTVNVMAETQGVVATMHVQKGDRVAVGDPLCTLEQGTRAAAVAQAEAALAQAQQDYDTNAALREKGLAPANTASALQAGLRAAQAALENAEAELARTEVTAPIAGIVQDPVASVGTMLAGTTPCATVVQFDPMLFSGSVPEVHIGRAQTGLAATIKTVTGQTAEGEVTYIAVSADPQTRTFPVEIEIPNADLSLRDGVTAEATVTLGTVPAHLLPQSALTLDDEGVLGVRAVGSDGRVAFHPVTIVKDSREGVHVTGLPPKVDVITVGQEFVKAGQKVDATNVTAETPTEGVPS